MEGEHLLLTRPPLAFIVEGKGEYNCYPSLVARIVNAHGFDIPRSNADGWGNIAHKLDRLLDEIVLAYHPYSVFITMDLRDALRSGEFQQCSELIGHLNEQIQEWLSIAETKERLQPLPDSIIVVLQIQQFETWFLGHIDPLVQKGFFNAPGHDCNNVDDEIPAPVGWIKQNAARPFNLKNPTFARTIVSLIEPSTIRQTSPSFDKFYREVQARYSAWLAACNADPNP